MSLNTNRLVNVYKYIRKGLPTLLSSLSSKSLFLLGRSGFGYKRMLITFDIYLDLRHVEEVTHFRTDLLVKMLKMLKMLKVLKMLKMLILERLQKSHVGQVSTYILRLRVL